RSDILWSKRASSSAKVDVIAKLPLWASSSANGMRCHKTPSKFVKSLTFGALTLWARSRLHEGTNIFSWPLTTCQNGLKRKRSPPMMPESCANS
ncbi:hypothetical protein Tco_0238898, partial [Tanacetum coccineum]